MSTLTVAAAYRYLSRAAGALYPINQKESANLVEAHTLLESVITAQCEQIVEAKKQWDEVARCLGVDGDNVDAVLKEAQGIHFVLKLVGKVP